MQCRNYGEACNPLCMYVQHMMTTNTALPACVHGVPTTAALQPRGIARRCQHAPPGLELPAAAAPAMSARWRAAHMPLHRAPCAGPLTLSGSIPTGCLPAVQATLPPLPLPMHNLLRRIRHAGYDTAAHRPRPALLLLLPPAASPAAQGLRPCAPRGVRGPCAVAMTAGPAAASSSTRRPARCAVVCVRAHVHVHACACTCMCVLARARAPVRTLPRACASVSWRCEPFALLAQCYPCMPNAGRQCNPARSVYEPG